MTEPQDKTKLPSPRRRRWRAGLNAALLVAAIVLAWQIHTVYIAPRPPQAVNPRPPVPPRAVPRAFGPIQPSDLKRPEARVGMTRLAKDPGQVPPPTGAEYAFGHEWPRDQGVRQQLRFWYAGQMQAAVDHYRRVLADKQLPLVSDKEWKGGSGLPERRLIFHADADPVGDQVVIRLRRLPGGRRKLAISVTIIRRAAAPAGQERNDE